VIGLGTLLRKELLEQWRTRRLLVVAIVFTAFGIGSPFLARYTPELVKALAGDQFHIVVPPPTARDAVDQFLKNLGQAGVLTAILLAMGSVANEKERGTAALLLTKPASRAAFLLAKLLAIGATLLISLLLAAIGGYAYTAFLFEALPIGGWAGMAGLLLLSLLVYTSLTFLGSVLSHSSLAAAGIGIGAMIVVATISILPTVGPYMPGGLSGAGLAIAMGRDPGGVIGPVLVNLAGVAALFGLAWLAFRRQEL
jgi:ABC-type transport system involved in multi-copper enzyme maturation, permease component